MKEEDGVDHQRPGVNLKNSLSLSSSSTLLLSVARNLACLFVLLFLLLLLVDEGDEDEKEEKKEEKEEEVSFLSVYLSAQRNPRQSRWLQFL